MCVVAHAPGSVSYTHLDVYKRQDLTQWKNAFRLAPVHTTHTELAIMGVIIIALMCIGWLVFRRNRVRSQKASRAASEKTAKLL